jgi:hypothetical protein
MYVRPSTCSVVFLNSVFAMIRISPVKSTVCETLIAPELISNHMTLEDLIC